MQRHYVPAAKYQSRRYMGWDLHRPFDNVHNWIPQHDLSASIVTLAVFVAGLSMRKGEWLQFIQPDRQSDEHLVDSHNATQVNYTDRSESHPTSSKLQGLHSFILFELIFSYTTYFSICGFLQWYFYIRQRDTSSDWKCQPNKFLTSEVELHEIIMGIINVGLGATIFSCLACYSYNGGMTTLYYRLDEYGWTWLFLSIPIHFLFQDAGAYYAHRILHMRFFYVNFHKWHHFYQQPTAFSATAMHPFDMMLFMMFMMLPAICMPLHVGIYYGQMIYIFYYGLITHSGVEMKSFWPWQPNVMFHDNHHQYFHVNFGFNSLLFDRLHGTLRRKDRLYNEDIYGGFGLSLN